MLSQWHENYSHCCRVIFIKVHVYMGMLEMSIGPCFQIRFQDANFLVEVSSEFLIHVHNLFYKFSH